MPPQNLYEDPLQPSRKGMLKPARNIKYPGAEFTMFQADGYGPHLYPNSAIRHHSDQPAHQQQPERSDNFNKRQTSTIPQPPFFTSRRQPATHLSLHPGGTVLPSYHPPMAVPNVPADSVQQQPQTTNPIEAISQAMRLLQGVFLPVQ